MLLSRGTVSTSKLFSKHPAFKFLLRGHYSSRGWFSLLLGVNFEILVLFEMRVWVRRVGCIGSWWGNREERDQRGDLGVDGWIILGRISRRWDVGIWTGMGLPRIETGGGRL